MELLTNLDMHKNELQNVRMQSLAAAPSNPVEGQMYYDTTLKKVGTFNGASWTYGDSGYALPPATAETLGGVKIGAGVNVAPDGTISVSPSAAQVQADWNQSDDGQPDFIKNKPTIPTTAGEIGAIPATEKGTANGVASLDENGKVPAAQLPSYVDDVVEFDNRAAFPPTGEDSKIYVDKETNKTYRWGGSDYVEISASLALGETSSTAFPGDRGKAVEDYMNIGHIPNSEKGASGGVATLDGDGKIPAAQLTITRTVKTLSAVGDTYTVTGYIVSVMIVDSVTKEQVLADVTYDAITPDANTNVTVACAVAPTNPLYVIILSV